MMTVAITIVLSFIGGAAVVDTIHFLYRRCHAKSRIIAIRYITDAAEQVAKNLQSRKYDMQITFDDVRSDVMQTAIRLARRDDVDLEILTGGKEVLDAFVSTIALRVLQFVYADFEQNITELKEKLKKCQAQMN